MSFICQIRRGNRIARLEHLQMINIEHNLYKRVETTKLSPRVLYMANRKTYASVFKCIYSLGSVSKSVSGRNSKKGPAKILTGPNKFVILGDKT